jgi:HEAT repeat protein
MRSLATFVAVVLLATPSFASNVSAENSLAEKLKHRVATLTTQLESSDVAEQLKAVEDLAELGPLGAEAVPGLARLTQSKDLALQHEVVITLGRIGPAAAAAVPALTMTLDSKSTIIRHSAMHALRNIGSASKSAIPKLSQLAREKDPLLSVAAAWALVGIDPDNGALVKSALPVLVSALNNKSEDIRSDAVAALGEVGAAAVSAVAAKLGDSNSDVCMRACDALAAIGVPAASAAPKLIAKLDDRDANVCWHAARALGAIGGDAEKAVPVLAKLLKHSSTPVRGHAASAIGRFGGNAKAAVPQLAATLRDEDATIRAAAARALGAIGPNAKAAVPALAKALDDEVGTVTIAAAEALGAVGKAAVPALNERLKDPNLNSLAATILGEIGPDAEAAVPGLVKLLSVDDEATKTEALLALAAIGPNAKAAVPALMKLLKSNATFGRAGAAYVLARIGAQSAIPVLKQTINEEGTESLQMASAWALVTLKPDNADFAQLAVPHLTAGLTNKRSLARREAANALGRIGGSRFVSGTERPGRRRAGRGGCRDRRNWNESNGQRSVGRADVERSRRRGALCSRVCTGDIRPESESCCPAAAQQDGNESRHVRANRRRLGRRSRCSQQEDEQSRVAVDGCRTPTSESGRTSRSSTHVGLNWCRL